MFFGGFIIILVIALIFTAGMIAVYVFYLLTLSRTLALCHPQTRTMNPGEVWMVFIPLFGLVWHFIVIDRLADSLAAEYRNRRLPLNEARPGYQLGLWALILPLCSFIPILGILTAVTGLVFLIMYWNRISAYKKELELHNMQFGQGNPYAFQAQTAQFQGGPNTGSTHIH